MNATDIFIIGGGINGAGIAADAAGRGLSVILCEQNDLASATSSSSSKLIHGGLRYLEYGEFRLVREALREREVLLRKAPHIIQPLEFIMPHNADLRPAWMIRIGLFLYDHLGGRQLLPGSKSLNLRQDAAGQALQEKYSKGFSYSDCWTDDARLVIANAKQAQQLGAKIFTRTQFITAYRQNGLWSITLKNTETQQTQTLQARAIVNAAGPWVENVIKQRMKLNSKNHISLVKGSHIIVPRLYPQAHAYILQNTDKRVIFIIPFLDKFSLIGTTDVPFHNELNHINIDDAEIDYLCIAVNRYLAKPITKTDVVWSYAGVRPLHSDNSENPSAITRDYTFEIDVENNQVPLLSIFGGKITTYRKLAEHALDELHKYFPHSKHAWTAYVPLPGGDISNADFMGFLQQLQQQYTWMPNALLHRYARNYGTLINQLLTHSKSINDLGEHFGNGLYAAEVDYLINHEWAMTIEDILWRRTKLGLGFPQERISALANYIISKIC